MSLNEPIMLARRGDSTAAATGDTKSAAAPSVAKPTEDELFFQPDDFLITGDDHPKHGRINHLLVAKRVGPLDTHNEAEYPTARGDKMITRSAWATPLAKPYELATGKMAIWRAHW